MAKRIERDHKVRSTGGESLLDIVAWLALLSAIGLSIYLVLSVGVVEIDSGRYGSETRVSPAAMSYAALTALSGFVVYAVLFGFAEIIRITKYQNDIPYSGEVFLKETNVVCSDCGNEVEPGVSQCGHCGGRLSE